MQLDVAFLLHAYQPWWQFSNVLEQIVKETYQPNWTKLVKDERYHLSLNLNYSLVELFKNNNMDFMNELAQQMIDTKRIDLTGTSAYHAFLPLVTDKQRDFQVVLQEKKMNKTFHGLTPIGFFLPEMGYTSELAEFLKEKGYQWTVADDQPFIAHYDVSPPYDTISSVNGLAVFLRSKTWSYDTIANSYINGKELAEAFAVGMRNWTKGKDAYLVIAMDFETFDHHKKGYWDYCIARFLDTIQRPVKGVDITLVNISELYEKYKSKMVERQIPKGSWSTSIEQYKQGNFFPLWNDTGYFRRVHQLMWQIYQAVEQSLDGNQEAYIALARGVNSCSWWSLPLGKPHLSVFGINEMVRAAELSGSSQLKEIYSIREELIGLGI